MPRKTNEKKPPVVAVVDEEPEADKALLAPAAKQSLQTPALPRKRFWRAIGVVTLHSLLLLLLLVGLACSLTPQGRAVARATMILPALIAANQPLPLQIAGEPISHTQMTVPSQSGTVYLDVYAPTSPPPVIGGVRNGVLIIPGAGDNRNVPQLINLSEALARSGLVVMDMVTPTLIDYDLSARDSDAVVQAFLALSHLPGMQGQHIGMISFSAGAPLACFGAADPRIRDQVAYVAAFGGYFQTENVLRAFGQRSISFDGKSEQWKPTDVPIQVLTNVITKPFTPAEQKTIKEAVAPGGTPLTLAEQAQLSPGARAAYQLLTGSAPQQVDANIAALPSEVRDELVELSPSRVVADIRAPIFLLHDRHDASLPFTESRDFAAALDRLHHEHDYVEFSIFDHVEMRSNLDIRPLVHDGSRLFALLTRILIAGS